MNEDASVVPLMFYDLRALTANTLLGKKNLEANVHHQQSIYCLYYVATAAPDVEEHVPKDNS